MSDQIARRERRIAWMVAALAVGAVAVLVILAAVLVDAPRDPPRATATPTPSPTTTMVPVKPSAEPVPPPKAAPRGKRVASTWLAQASRESGISRTAVEAYALASVRLARERPGCHVGWTTLAGIGAIESGHGTNGGARLRSDGTTTRPIVGPPLDGSSGTARIPSDDESARWHGDPRWDHAVGPMQFIPSTWRRWASDGNDDGRADPNNILDAAYAAGRYLCASGRDLRTGEGWTQAIFSYNHSDAYVRDVVARANAYARQ